MYQKQRAEEVGASYYFCRGFSIFTLSGNDFGERQATALCLINVRRLTIYKHPIMTLKSDYELVISQCSAHHSNHPNCP